jgi:hypothetical protein
MTFDLYSWLPRCPICVAVNACLATLLGAYLAEVNGAILGLIVVIIVSSAPKILPALWRSIMHTARAARHMWRSIRPVLGLALLPAVLVLTALAVLILYACNAIMRPIRTPAIVARQKLSAGSMRILHFFKSFFVEPALPLILANVVAFLIIVCVLAGIEFASYIVFAAVPMMVIVLMVSSLGPYAGPGKISTLG